jgi:hypothetical protein
VGGGDRAARRRGYRGIARRSAGRGPPRRGGVAQRVRGRLDRDRLHAQARDPARGRPRQWRTWHDDGLDITIAVNLSVVNLLDGDLNDDIARILGEERVEAGGLELEITETTIMSDPLRATAMLEQLAAMGLRLSIDDYGTGHSSLAYLRRLPVRSSAVRTRGSMPATSRRASTSAARSRPTPCSTSCANAASPSPPPPAPDTRPSGQPANSVRERGYRRWRA